MCAVAADIARKRRKLSPAAAAAEAATELGLAEDDEDIAFAEAQLQALAEVRTVAGVHSKPYLHWCPPKYLVSGSGRMRWPSQL